MKAADGSEGHIREEQLLQKMKKEWADGRTDAGGLIQRRTE